jgi:hypothetical protein
MSAGPAVRALMTGAIDYAGLFPPAGLGMADAVARFASYRRGPLAWMLGRFVVPASRLGELGEALWGVAGDGAPWPVSAIARPSDATALEAFNAAHAGRAVIDMVEVPPVTAADAASLGALAGACATYAEVPIGDDPVPVIHALKAVGVCAKVRTGGVTVEAFPAPANVARFILACRDAGLAFKATAGLHHVVRAEYPLTYEPGCARGTMYGFANMLLAATAAATGAGADALEAILTARGDTALTITGEAATVAGRRFDAVALAAARRHLMHSFGSCSFEEPLAELTQRGCL